MMIAIMIPLGFVERADPAPVNAGGRGGPLGLGVGAGEGGPAGTAGREDATGGAGADGCAGTEGDGGDTVAELEARGPDGIAGAGDPVFCGGTKFGGVVFDGTTVLDGTLTAVTQGTVTTVVVVIVIGGTTGDAVD